MERSIKLNNCTCYYEIKKQITGARVLMTAEITGASGVDPFLTVPDKLEEAVVYSIGKKAFLGQRSLVRVTLAESVRFVADWSFAQCTNLREIKIPGEDVTLGRGVFDDCEKLEFIYYGRDCSKTLAALIGAIPTRLKAEYLLTGQGLGTAEWYFKWDKRLAELLAENDEEGYTNLVLCGEEDLMNSLSGFVSDKKRRKAGLCLTRLLFSDKLSETDRELFTDYVRTHVKGCPSDEAWQEVYKNHGDNLDYYRLLADIGGITEDNVDEMLKDMGNNHAEAKAFLISIKQENKTEDDFFAAFTL